MGKKRLIRIMMIIFGLFLILFLFSIDFIFRHHEFSFGPLNFTGFTFGAVLIIIGMALGGSFIRKIIIEYNRISKETPD